MLCKTCFHHTLPGALVSKPRWHFYALMMSLGVVTELPQPPADICQPPLSMA